MKLPSALLALAAFACSVSAQYKGFNSGATFTNGQGKVQADFEAEFRTAQSIPGQSSGFNSVRLFTTIQVGTLAEPISAIPAAINTRTTMLLGLWASAGQAQFNNELAALQNAINQYGTAFTDLVAGISVGSEDLYRISPTGVINMAGLGAGPEAITSYINQVRDLIGGTALEGKGVGHVDTWTAWVNGTNQPVVDACDWIGMDAYPYFQDTQANSIENADTLFFDALAATRGAVGGKAVWVTETGWPFSGPLSGQGEAGVQNAERYWEEVGCALFNNVNTWWYILRDSNPDPSNPSFGVYPPDLSAPRYDLSCPGQSPGASSAISSSSSSTPVTSVGPSSTLDEVTASSVSLSSTPTSIYGGGDPTSQGSSSAFAPTSASSNAPSSSAASSTEQGGQQSSTASPPVASASVSSTPRSSAAGNTASASSAPAGSTPGSSAAGSTGSGDRSMASASSASVPGSSAASSATLTLSAPDSSAASMSVPASSRQSSGVASIATPLNSATGSGAAGPVVTVTAPDATVTVSTVVTTTMCPVACIPGPGSPTTIITEVPQNTPSAPASPARPAGSSIPSTPSGQRCPDDLAGEYQYPHLIIPVNSSAPDQGASTSYFPHISPEMDTLVNFDIPPTYAGRTCTLVFLFPAQAQLETSSFSLSGSGGMDVAQLAEPATEGTSYNSAPNVAQELKHVPTVSPRNKYVISSGACAAGRRVGYRVSATGSLDLRYFQDWNPCPIGLFVTAE